MGLFELVKGTDISIEEKVNQWRLTTNMVLLYPKYKSLSELEQDYTDFLNMPYEAQRRSNWKAEELYNNKDNNSIYSKLKAKLLENLKDSKPIIFENGIMSLSYSIPYFTPDEIIRQGISGINKPKYGVPDNTSIDGGMTVQDFIQQYTSDPATTISDPDLMGRWNDTVKKLYSGLDFMLCDNNKIKARKQSLLDLGCNPNVSLESANTISKMKMIAYLKKISKAQNESTSIHKDSHKVIEHLLGKSILSEGSKLVNLGFRKSQYEKIFRKF